MADDMEMHMANEMWVFFHISLSIVCIFLLGAGEIFRYWIYWKWPFKGRMYSNLYEFGFYMCVGRAGKAKMDKCRLSLWVGTPCLGNIRHPWQSQISLNNFSLTLLGGKINTIFCNVLLKTILWIVF